MPLSIKQTSTSDCFKSQHGQTRDELLKELDNVKNEKEAFLLQIGILSTELEKSQLQDKVMDKRGKERDDLNDSVQVKSIFIISMPKRKARHRCYTYKFLLDSG